MVDQAVLEPKNKRPNRGQQGRNRQRGSKGKGSKQQPRFTARRSAPKFLYHCKFHGEKATKTPCERGHEDRKEAKFSESPLGTWRCSVTRKKCKVERRSPVPQESNNEPVQDIRA